MGDFKNVLITGGAGFIGSNYVHYAVKKHPTWSIRVLDKLTYAGNPDNLEDVAGQITFIQGDIANPEDLRKSVTGVDAIINFAAESHVDRSLLDSRPFVRTNVEGTLLLLEEAKKNGVQRFLQVSTDEVYGDLAGTTHHSLETDKFAPRSPYAATKASAEHLVQSYYISYGLNVVITRGSNTYGPFQYPEKIIPLFITNAFENKPLPLYGSGTAVRDYMHVEDHCVGIDLVLQEGLAGNAYNLGARLEINGKEVAERILALMKKPKELTHFVKDRPGHDYRYAVDPSKAEQIGWKRLWDFPKGLEQTVAWYLANERWWRKVKERLEFQKLDKEWYANRK